MAVPPRTLRERVRSDTGAGTRKTDDMNSATVTYSRLVPEIMNADLLQYYVKRGRLIRIQRACFGREAAYSVESLPAKYRAEVYRRYPDLQERKESEAFMDGIVPDGAAAAFYAGHTLPDGRNLPSAKQEEYANNCAILNAFRRRLEECNSHRRRQSKRPVSAALFWTAAAEALPRIGDVFPNSLPGAPRRLHGKFREYLRDGYACFISKKWQNGNAAKVDDDVKESVLVRLIAHHNNLDNAFIANAYNSVASVKGWKPISPSAVAVWREKTDLVTAAGRLGATEFRATRTMQVKRSRPSAAFLMWVLDGWTAEFLYQDTKTDRRGRRVTGYSNRLAIEVVLDPSCDYPIGYAIGPNESPHLIAEALRNAVRHGRELTGEMLIPNQIQCDHYQMKTMKGLYQDLCRVLTPAAVRNAKGKVIEPYFKYINTTYGKTYNNWSGFGITSRPDRQPNSDRLNALRHTFPDEAGCREQLERVMAQERASKRRAFMDLLENLKPEFRLPLSKEIYLLRFGAETGRRNTLEGSGLRPTLLGVRRDYDCFDIAFRECASVKWAVRYDPEDLSEVLAVSEDGSRRFMLQEKHVQPMALADRREGDAEELRKVYDFNRRLEAHVGGVLAAAEERTRDLLGGLPAVGEADEVLIGEEPDNILRRLLLCDSDGQHKLPRDRRRLGTEDVEAMTAKAVRVPSAPEDGPEEDGGYSAEDYTIF